MKKALLVLVITAAIALCGCGTTTNDNNSADEEKVCSFAAGKGTFYYPDEIYNNYLTVEKDFDGTAQDVVNILYELGNYIVPVSVNSYYKQGNTMYIDFTDSLRKAAHGGSAREYFVIRGTANTLISCFDVEYVRITINGRDLKTQHGDYSQPLPLQS